MITIALCLSFISIYCLYAVSDRVEIEKKGIMLFFKNKQVLAVVIAGLTFLVSTIIFTYKFGLGVGIFTSLSLWMVLASLIILFLPFQVIKWPHLALAFLVVAIIEMNTLLV